MPLFDWGRDAWAGLREMQRELSRLLGISRPGEESRMVGGGGYPPVSIFNRDDAMLVLAEVPGVPLEEIDLSITADTLVLKGVKPKDDVPPDQFHRRERGSGSFSRTIVLPDPVRPEGVKASLTRGILRIELPKSTAAKPHKIGVQQG